MNEELENQVYELVAKNQTHNAIQILEDALNQLPATPYHAIIGRDLLHMTVITADYLRKFYESVPANADLRTIYIEMNAFAINSDCWFIDAFGYKSYNGIDDLDWLSDWDTSDFTSLTISGYEEIQKAFKTFYLDQNKSEVIRQSGEIAEHLIILRLQELVRAAHVKAVESISALQDIIVLSTAHDFDLISFSDLN